MIDYAPRDRSYLKLGQRFGDCTSEKREAQTNRGTENIFWANFAWILDRNYQIMRIFLNGTPAIKVHFVPLCLDVSDTEGNPLLFLCVDAIETTRSLSNSDTNQGIDKQELFDKIISEVLALADRMKIEAVFCERFSNTAWVREKLSNYPEIYLDTRKIIKIDELEDVFECANQFCIQFNYPEIEQIFMEIQAKNTYLMPDSPGLKKYCKSFAVLRGNNHKGIPIKQLFGI